MPIYSKTKLFSIPSSHIHNMAEAVSNRFSMEGYEIQTTNMMNGGCEVSVTKGGVFRTVLGLRSSLNVTLTPQQGGIFFDAHVGIFGQSVIPTLITLFIAWPVILPQIWGMIQSAALDDQALEAAEQYAQTINVNTGHQDFCPHCGKPAHEGASFCPYTGMKL